MEIGLYSGPWTRSEVCHLLGRTMFGATSADISVYSSVSMNQAVQMLLQSDPTPAAPVNDYNNVDLQDPNVPFGTSWIDDIHPNNPDITSARVVSLKSWWIDRMLHQGSTIHQKLIFF